MSVLSVAFFTALEGDAAVTNVLRKFKGRPAIFTYAPVPKDVEGPYIITSGEVSNTPNDTKDTEGSTVTRDISVYAPASGSTVTIDALAESVRLLFHRSSLPVAGFKTIYVNVTGPREADEEDVYGRIITVEILLSRE